MIIFNKFRTPPHESTQKPKITLIIFKDHA